ncbi:MAG: TetR/AcrR family transcriptional regulator [Myxococcota bacterium]
MPTNTQNRRRRPQQDRSRSTVEAIVDAAAQILEAQGPQHATTNHIAERAGVSIGTLYQYFPNKQALFTELARRFIEELGTATEESLESISMGPMQEVVPQFLHTLGRLHGTSPRLRSFLFQQPGSQVLMRDFNERIEAVVARVLARRPEFRDGNPTLTAQVVVRAVDGVMRDTTLREPERVHERAFIDELSRLVLGYLMLSATGG